MSLLKDQIELNIQEAELGTQKALGNFPPLVRWLIILIVIAIIPAYFIAKTVAEKTLLAKYQQLIPVAKPSFTNPQALKPSPVSVTTLGPNQYFAITSVTNPNLDLSLDQVPFEFVFYNAQKQEVYSYADTLYLLPNETKYLTAPTFTASDIITYAVLQLPPNLPWQKRLEIPTVNLTTSVPDSYQQALPQALVVEGNFYNDSPYSLKQVRLTFVLFNAQGQIIGTSQRDESTVSSFERRSYKQLWPNLAAPDLSKIIVTATTDTLDPNNLSVPDQSQNAASDLSR